MHHDDLFWVWFWVQHGIVNGIHIQGFNSLAVPRMFNTSGKDSGMSIINAGKRMGELGFKYEVTCPECGKGLNQDDAYGHVCEV